MSQLQDLQFPIDRAIFAEVLACIPKTWTRAKLEARSQDASAGGTKMTIRIDALGQPGIALVSDASQDRVRELFLLHQRFGVSLRGIVYTYNRQPDGRWSFVGDYDFQ
jgi:hypothetical protein